MEDTLEAMVEGKARSFPKIFHVGDRYVRDIFENEVEITEKVDGSQFCFGKLKGEVVVRSKGQMMTLDAPNKMFNKAVDYVKTLDLPEDVLFYGEYLNRPCHNTLEYERTPKNWIALFGIAKGDVFESDYEVLKAWAVKLDIDVVPLLFKGKIEKQEEMLKLLDTMSFLGKSKIEGFVIKQYTPVMVGNVVMPIKAAKFVSEAFKEKHTGTWAKEHTGKGKWETYKESYKTEARWEKAVQHLKEKGLLTETPKDIGSLIKETMNDITIEEKENIKDFLWKEFGEELLRTSIGGLPEWYKKKLAATSFK